MFEYASRRMSNYNPPDHTRLRSLVTKAFTARRVGAMLGRTEAQVMLETLSPRYPEMELAEQTVEAVLLIADVRLRGGNGDDLAKPLSMSVHA